MRIRKTRRRDFPHAADRRREDVGRLRACPDDLWSDRSRRPEFWYVAFHALFFLDLYLSDSEEESPPAPFTLSEMDPAGVLPDRPYAKDELQTYLEHGRRKCRAVTEALTDERARLRRAFGSIDGSVLELLLYNARQFSTTPRS